MDDRFDVPDNRDSVHENYHYYRFEDRGETVPDLRSGKEVRSRESFGKKIATTAVLALVFGLVSGVAFQAVNRLSAVLLPSRTSAVTENSAALSAAGPVTEETEVSTFTVQSGGLNTGATVADVAAEGLPSIVAITSVSIQEIPDFFGQFWGFGGMQKYPSTGSGSGIIVGRNEDELLIATNSHVVTGADTITVCFIGSDVQSAQRETESMASGEAELGTENAVSGKLKGEDAANDLAVIAVKLSDIPQSTLEQLSVAELGDSESLVVGEQVVAIGNALGFGQSVTSGYVSALNRAITTSDGATNDSLIQTDAAINPGNSGGALLNMRGQVVGINSAKYADNAVEGMGYAIPMATARPILEELMNRKTRDLVEDKDKAAYLGVSLLDLTSEMIQMYDLPKGAYVKEVTPGGPAEAAGLRKGDILSAMDGQNVRGREDVIGKLAYYEAGEEISLVIYRSSGGEYEAQTVSLVLGRKEETYYDDLSRESEISQRGRPDPGIENFFNYFG